MMKGRLLRYVCLGVAILAATPAYPQRASRKEPIRIGVVLALTGSAAEYGTSAKKGVDLAVKEINQRGGFDGRLVELVVHDSQTNPARAAASLPELKNAGIRAVIGDVSSDCAIAMAPVAEQLKLVMMSPGASTPELSQYGSYVFRNWQSDQHEGEADANFAYTSLTWRRVAVISVDHAYGRGLARTFTSKFQELGGVTHQLRLPGTASNYRDQLRTLISIKKVDGVFVAAYTRELENILQQRLEMNLKVPVLTVQAFENVKPSHPAAQGVYFSAVQPPSPTAPAVTEFRADYRREYGEDPLLCSDSGYDAVRILVRILAQVGDKPEDVRDAVRQIHYSGAAGVTSFDDHGDVDKLLMFNVIKDGQVKHITGPIGELPNNPPQSNAPSPAPVGPRKPAETNWTRVLWAVITALAVAAALGIARKYTLLGPMLQWQFLIGRFAFRQFWRRRGIRIVTIDDYVEVLEKLRDAAELRCQQSQAEKPELLIHVYTRQIPRDWPLWQETFDPAKNTTALEEYFFRFQNFLDRVKDAKYSVAVKRVIVIDAARSPRGKERLDQLRRDVSSEYFQTYVKMLHRDPADAYYCVHDRAWPSWLSDAVFYGVRENGAVKWLWAAMTSYVGGDDLILLRVHRLGSKRRLRLRLPWPVVKTLEEVADNVGSANLNIHPISSLQTSAT